MSTHLNLRTIMATAKVVEIPPPPAPQLEGSQPDLAGSDWVKADRRKRAFDLVAASLLLLLFLPAIAVIMTVLAICHPGPIFFSHTRIGRDGKPFKCLKFRSMCVNADDVLAAHLKANPDDLREWVLTQKLRHDPRILPIGSFLRKSSLDELPQLINVLMGHMSLVGPRPITAAEIANYGDKFCHYMSVRPGVSGLWQISGRSDTSYDERVTLDVQYARHNSIWGDVKILLRTVGVVLRGRGAY
ncbi:sugar transferase [Loktanella sp. R86503]|uniref:sugar transferase n=1 Tax=Loktanella sp. R86503 TaxID=3093847 RepID=UPI0036D802F6